MIELKLYSFKEEFCKELNIPRNQSERRLKELLDWLNNFYDYEFFVGRPNRILIKSILGDYQPLPRKVSKKYDELEAQKKKDYADFTIAALGTEFKPNSKAKIARDAIYEFGHKKYQHSNVEGVARRYVKGPFDTYGETDNHNVWVYYETYEPLDLDVLKEWRDILKEEHISEQEAANAFYRQEQGEDISEEKSYYKRAMERFKKEYGCIPVLVKNWRLRI